jgi:hypothetical protein
MEINKINLDGTEYSVGGSKAKLVGTASWNDITYCYRLTKNLTKGFYLIVINDSNISYILINDNENSEYFGSLFTFLQDGTEETKVFRTYIFIDPEGMCLNIDTADDSGECILGYETAKIEIYQLPITLGGNE